MTLLNCTLAVVFPAICSAAPDKDADKTGSDAIRLESAVITETAAWHDSADVPAPQQHAKKGEAGLIGVGIRLSTLGAGAEVGVSLSNRLNVRGGFKAGSHRLVSPVLAMP